MTRKKSPGTSARQERRGYVVQLRKAVKKQARVERERAARKKQRPASTRFDTE